MLLASGLLAIQVGIFSPEQFRLGLYVNWSIPIALLSSIGLIATILVYIYDYRDTNCRYFDFALATGISILLLLAVPGRTVMEADESSMIATAQGIYFNSSPFGAVTGVYSNDGTFISFYEKLDKRGVFFPLWIAILDHVFGPNPDHRLALSWLSGLFVLFLSLRLSRRFLPSSVVPVIAILLPAMPVFAIHTRGGTFDTMNVAVLLLVIHSIISFWYRPEWRTLLVVSAAAAVVGQIRNESLLAAGLALFIVIARIAFSPDCTHLRKAWIWLLPWLAVPAAIRRAVPFDNELPEATLEIWSVNNFQDNVSALAQVIVFGGYYNYGNAIVGLAAVVGFALVVVTAWRRPYPNLNTMTIVLASLSLLPVIIMFYLHGEPDTPVTARYFIPIIIALCMLALVPFAFISHRRFAAGSAMALSVYAFWVSSYWSIEAPALQLMERPTNAAAIARVLKGQDAQCNAVIVTGLAVHQIVRGFTSMPRSVLDSITQEQLERYAGRKLYVVDLEPHDRLPPPEYLERILEHRGGLCTRTIRGVTFISEVDQQGLPDVSATGDAPRH